MGNIAKCPRTVTTWFKTMFIIGTCHGSDGGVTAGLKTRSQVSPSSICSAQSGTSDFHCCYHSTNVRHVHLVHPQSTTSPFVSSHWLEKLTTARKENCAFVWKMNVQFMYCTSTVHDADIQFIKPSLHALKCKHKRCNMPYIFPPSGSPYIGYGSVLRIGPQGETQSLSRDTVTL